MGVKYDDRDIMYLDEKGSFYSTHISAMTAEGLHSKSVIAAELAFRDSIIVDQNKHITELMEIIEGWKTNHGKLVDQVELFLQSS